MKKTTFLTSLVLGFSIVTFSQSSVADSISMMKSIRDKRVSTFDSYLDNIQKQKAAAAAPAPQAPTAEAVQQVKVEVSSESKKGQRNRNQNGKIAGAKQAGKRSGAASANDNVSGLVPSPLNNGKCFGCK